MKISRFNQTGFYSPRFILMLSIFAAYLFGWVFSEIAENIWIEHGTFPFDQATKAWMTNGQSPLTRQLFSMLTLLGSVKWLSMLTLAVSGFLLYRKQRLESLLLAGGFALTISSVVLIKWLSSRARPLSDLSILENSMAFPSGHMANSLFVYGFLAYLCSRNIKNKWYAFGVILAGIALASLIGLSRIYLNVHWLSDVLGGFTLAAAYLCLCAGLMESLTKKRCPPLTNTESGL